MNLTDAQFDYLHRTNFIETARGLVMSPEGFDTFLRKQGTHALRYEAENAKSDNAKRKAVAQLGKKLKYLKTLK